MKNRSTVVLTELAIMLTVAAIACAVCLGVFSKAKAISKANTLRDNAYIQMQNMAELFTYYNGDINKVADHIGPHCSKTLTAEFDGFTVTLTPSLHNSDYLAQCIVTATSLDGKKIGALTVLSQKEALEND